MALSVPVQKDLAEYEPKFIGKFTLRTIFAIALTVAMALLAGLYIKYVICVSVDDFGWLIFLAAVPGCVVGFFKPDEMRPEEWLPLWFAHAMTRDDIVYRRTFAASEADGGSVRRKEQGFDKKEKKALEQLTGRGAELYRPSELL